MVNIRGTYCFIMKSHSTLMHMLNAVETRNNIRGSYLLRKLFACYVKLCNAKIRYVLKHEKGA